MPPVRDETRTLLVDELANELRHYRHSNMASAALAEHILAIPRIHEALTASQVEAGEVLTGAMIEAGFAKATDVNAVIDREEMVAIYAAMRAAQSHGKP